CVVIGGGETRKWRRKRYRAEESALRILLPHPAIDDEIDAVQDRLGEAGGGAGALLVAVIERCGSAPAVRDQFVNAYRWIDDAAAGESELLIVAGHRQEGLEVGRGVVEVADPVAL